MALHRLFHRIHPLYKQQLCNRGLSFMYLLSRPHQPCYRCLLSVLYVSIKHNKSKSSHINTFFFFMQLAAKLNILTNSHVTKNCTLFIHVSTKRNNKSCNGWLFSVLYVSIDHNKSNSSHINKFSLDGCFMFFMQLAAKLNVLTYSHVTKKFYLFIHVSRREITNHVTGGCSLFFMYLLTTINLNLHI